VAVVHVVLPVVNANDEIVSVRVDEVEDTHECKSYVELIKPTVLVPVVVHGPEVGGKVK
jgi:hypothetical protein